MTGRLAAATVVVASAASALLGGWAPFGRERTSLPAHSAARLQASHPQVQVTFTRDVAPILFSACVTCHRPQGIAPFSLLTYDDATSHAAAIVAATQQRVMPPWKPAPGYGEFLDERRLTSDQIATLRRWVDDGLLEGDPALLPRPPTWSGQWQAGRDSAQSVRPSAERIGLARRFALP